MIRKLFHFRGGVHLRDHKQDSTAVPVANARLPKQLVLPLRQHIGAAAEPIVAVGDHVLKGQLIGRGTERISASVHASSSGTVTAIEARAIPHPSGLNAPCIVIDTDGKDEWGPHQGVYDYHALTPAQLRDIIREAGIVGMGGAGFPSFVKLDPHGRAVDTLIINGAECEPYITCDEMLLRERSLEVLAGMRMMRHALQARHCIIGIENNKQAAIAALQQQVANARIHDVEVVPVPTAYPAGGEKQLIQALTGLEVPSGGLPSEIGVVCHNVGTAYAVYRAVEFGEPLVSRLVTVTGSVAHGRNLEVLIGTPVAGLIEESGGSLKTLTRVIIGGPMMGFATHTVDVPVVKTTNCILVQSAVADVPLPSRQAHAMPCIRCGACADACPVTLLPQQLYWYARAKDFDKIQDHHLFDCIECGCCDYVCPSHIPLVQYFRFAKTAIWKQEREKHAADISRERHEFHLARLEREKQERENRHKQHVAAVTGKAPDDDKKAAIQAALERVKAKREQAHPKNVDHLSAEQQQLIAEVEARRAKHHAPAAPPKDAP